VSRESKKIKLCSVFVSFDIEEAKGLRDSADRDYGRAESWRL